MAADKPHPLGLSAEDSAAVSRFFKERQEEAARAAAPKDNRPEDVPSVVAKIVDDFKSGKSAPPPKDEKKSRFGFLRRG